MSATQHNRQLSGFITDLVWDYDGILTDTFDIDL